MSDAENVRELTERLTVARLAEDAEAIAALLAADVLLEPPASVGIPAVEGRDSVARVLSGSVAKLYMTAGMRREVLRTVVDEDVAVVKSRLAGRTIEDVDYDNDYVTFYLWRDGAVVRIEEHLDTLRASECGVDRLVKERSQAR
jgi:ketosteroid isomerase-like protein